MSFFLFNFTEDFLLIGYILSGILISSFTTTTNKLIKKKRFYLLIKSALIITVCVAGINLSQFQQFSTQIYPFPDSLGLSEFYNITIGDSLGNIFFRKDFLILYYNLILTFLVSFYLLLVYAATKTAEIEQKYFLEIPVLIVTVFLSLKVFLMAYDFMLIVLALELTAFCSIILISLQIVTPNQSVSVFPFEAAIKYFIFNAVSISLFLFAVSGYYSLFKTLNLLNIGTVFFFEPAFCYENIETILFFHLFFFTAYLMKIGAAPFHQWVPDVYEGAELLVTAFLVLLVGPILNLKFFVFIKALLPVFELNTLIFGGFFVSGLLSIIIGSLNAFTQFRIKRFLAYTGITHLGYMLISFGTGTFLGFFSSFFYLMFYIITNCIFFGMLVLSKRFSGLTLIFFNQLKTLFNNNLLLMLFFLIPLFSFAGFPPFGGFFSKFVVLLALIDLQKVLFTLLVLIYILISAYLYLRFIKVVLFENHNYFQLFLPILVKFDNNQGFLKYYNLKNDYKHKRSQLNCQNFLLFLVFVFNTFLFLILFCLPTFCLSFQKPLLTLFLFF